MSDDGKLFVGGLSFNTDEESLNAAFCKFGAIEKVDVIRDRDTGNSRGFGFVKFENIDDARNAQEAMHGKSLDGRSIRVDEAGKGGGGRGGGGGGGGYGGGGGRGGGGGGYNNDRGYGGGGDRGYGGSSYRSGGGGRDQRDQRSGY